MIFGCPIVGSRLSRDRFGDPWSLALLFGMPSIAVRPSFVTPGNREITRFDGWKAFVVHFEERSAGDNEGNGIIGDSLEPRHKCWRERLKHLSKVLVVTFETLDACQVVLKSDCRWPDQTEGQAADFRKIECSIVRLRGYLYSSSDLLPIREEKGLSILHEVHDTR
jgi:hypothetical protein